MDFSNTIIGRGYLSTGFETFPTAYDAEITIKREFMPFYFPVDDKEERKNMIIKEYNDLALTKQGRLAKKLGVIDDNGNLTQEGKDLLLEVLFCQFDIRNKFDAVVEEIAKAREKKCQ